RPPDRGGDSRRDPAQSRGAPRLPGRRRGVILEIKGIETYYGIGHVLHGLSLAVAEGEVVALLGRNGAGKTTTLRSISGLTPPRAGEIRYKRRSMLLVEQNVEMALQLADRVYVIDHGTVVFEGPPAVLRGEEGITATYLGVGG